MNNLERFQQTVGYALTALAVLHIPILGAIAWLLGRDVVNYMLAAALLAAIPVYFHWAGHRTMHVAFALAIALVGQTSLLVLAFQDHPWQVEMHFYYFAVLAMLSGFCGWRALLFAAVLIAAHHLTLNEFLPSAVYPGEADLVRVAVHAIVVVIETAMLIFIGHTIRSAFAQAEAARGEAERAANELQRLGAAREQELSKTVSRADRLGDLLEGFKQEMAGSVEILHQAAAGLQTHAASLGVTSAHAAEQAASASAASADTASQVTLAAETGQQLAQTIGEVGSSAANSSQLAAAAVAEAKATNDTINEMAEVAGEIGNVTELITAIAAQTNLLALNATIEAARAGEAGRGFAVVAQEVKALAGQTASATQEIAGRIAAMQSTTARSVAAIQAITRTIEELNHFSGRIAAAVDQQAAAAREISRNVSAAAAGVEAVGGSVEKMEGVAEQTAQAVGAVNSAATEIASQTRAIRERVHLFTQRIEAMRA